MEAAGPDPGKTSTAFELRGHVQLRGSGSLNHPLCGSFHGRPALYQPE